MADIAFINTAQMTGEEKYELARALKDKGFYFEDCTVLRHADCDRPLIYVTIEDKFMFDGIGSTDKVVEI